MSHVYPGLNPRHVSKFIIMSFSFSFLVFEFLAYDCRMVKAFLGIL